MTASFHLRLPESLMRKVRELAKADGVSINTWLMSATAQKIGSVETAEQFLKEQAAGRQAGDLKRLLRRAAGQPPVDGDEIGG